MGVCSAWMRRGLLISQWGILVASQLGLLHDLLDIKYTVKISAVNSSASSLMISDFLDNLNQGVLLLFYILILHFWNGKKMHERLIGSLSEQKGKSRHKCSRPFIEGNVKIRLYYLYCKCYYRVKVIESNVFLQQSTLQ